MTIKSVTIVGATGSLGHQLLATITRDWPSVHVTAVSRDEHKQAVLKRHYPKTKFVIGDIRDIKSVGPHLGGRDIVFHVAAMKHVDIVENNPAEAIKTNILGTLNVATACIATGVKHMIFSSTDKAVDPINIYGHTKAIGERTLLGYNKVEGIGTRFSVYRWGNVVGSQGSAIPFFIQTLLTEKKVYLTDASMTRYWIPIEWAVRYMLRTFPDASKTEAMVPPIMKTANLIEICDVLSELLGIEDYERVYTGIRPGEKLHEAMHSYYSDKYVTSELSPKYTREELREMLLPFIPSVGAAA